MTRTTESQQPVIKAVGTLSKLFGKNPYPTFCGILCVILSWVLYEKRQDRLDAVQTTKYYQTVTDRILDKAMKNTEVITEVKVKQSVEDSLQKKTN